ncbi:unnamed protein product [Darwinula stevensoni]|uniref:SET domain-containing protein n=1 Tax=Darwinula stevensoni TaxID=69355 RepID=A0A7R8X6R4_9CRUS|nr:unnamed protein product [Darwinula stevensoni]CAG0881754.1 unnamed protein product [Darwinula stevensoni]
MGSPLFSLSDPLSDSQLPQSKKKPELPQESQHRIDSFSNFQEKRSSNDENRSIQDCIMYMEATMEEIPFLVSESVKAALAKYDLNPQVSPAETSDCLLEKLKGMLNTAFASQFSSLHDLIHPIKAHLKELNEVHGVSGAKQPQYPSCNSISMLLAIRDLEGKVNEMLKQLALLDGKLREGQWALKHRISDKGTMTSYQLDFPKGMKRAGSKVEVESSGTKKWGCSLEEKPLQEPKQRNQNPDEKKSITGPSIHENVEFSRCHYHTIVGELDSFITHHGVVPPPQTNPITHHWGGPTTPISDEYDRRRYMKARRDIAAGETIFVDRALAVGPKIYTVPVCLGCYKRVDGSYLCSRCRWPLCDEECEKSAGAHRDAECKVFAESGQDFHMKNYESSNPMYECILPLRCLLLEESDPDGFQRLLTLESHQELRKGTEIYRAEQVNVVKYIRDYLKQGDRWSEDVIHRVCGVIQINAFEVRNTTFTNYCGIYPLSCIMEHSCLSNTSHSCTPEGEMVVRSTVPILAGEHVSTTYAYTLQGTQLRRLCLKAGKLFDCKCPRCADPTEFSTCFSAFRCPKCSSDVLSSDPLDEDAVWKCRSQDCPFSITGAQAKKLNEVIGTDVEHCRSDVKMLEARLVKYASSLGRNNWHLVGIELLLSQVYGRTAGYILENLSPELLARKEALCRHVLRVADVLEPGKSRLRGMLMYELQAALVMRVTRDFQDGIVVAEPLLKCLKEARGYLQEAQDILTLEPEWTREGTIGRSCEASLQELQSWIDGVEKQVARADRQQQLLEQRQDQQQQQ